MKRGDSVAVCHDGKWGRRVQGEVVATRKGHHLKVRFPHPDDGTPVEFWARRRPGRRVYFAGWADISYFCPWYAVRPWPKATATV